MDCLAKLKVIEGFGEAVALSGDTVVVGAPNRKSPGKGAAYIFTQASGRFGEQARLASPPEVSRFASTVAVSAGIVAVGVPEGTAVVDGAREQNRKGTVTVFRDTGQGWQPFGTVETPASSGSTVIRFALSNELLAVSGFALAPQGGFVDLLTVAGGQAP